MNDCSCEKTKGHFLYCLINIHLNKHSVQQNLNGKRGLLLSAIPQVNLYISLLPQSTKHLHSVLLSCTLSFPACQKIWKPCSFLALLSLCDPGLTRVPRVLLPWLGSHPAHTCELWARERGGERRFGCFWIQLQTCSLNLKKLKWAAASS